MGSLFASVVVKFLQSSAGEAVLQQIVAELFAYLLSELKKASGSQPA